MSELVGTRRNSCLFIFERMSNNTAPLAPHPGITPAGGPPTKQAQIGILGLGGVTRAGQALYGQVIDQVVTLSSTRAAEMTKLLENIHRAVNIGLVNELKIVCDRLGLDIHEVIRAAATKPFGFTPTTPGTASAATASPSTPSTSPGRRAHTASAPASSNWPARSTPPGPSG
jgi:hypothetical protein